MTRAEKEKQVRKESIIAAAEKVFSQKGYHEASMDAIAQEAQFTKRTVYQYFLNKEDLYFAVTAAGFEALKARFLEALSQSITALEKLKLVGQSFFDFYKEFPHRIKLFTLISSTSDQRESCPHYQQWRAASDGLFDEMTKLVEQGKREGSFRSDLDGPKTAASMMFLSTGFFYLLSINGPTFSQHFQLMLNDFVDSTLNLLSQALVNPQRE